MKWTRDAEPENKEDKKDEKKQRMITLAFGKIYDVLEKCDEKIDEIEGEYEMYRKNMEAKQFNDLTAAIKLFREAMVKIAEHV